MSRLAVVATAGLLCAATALPAAAQLSRMDRGPLIDGLRRWGMRELLQHMVDTEPMDDPTIARQVLIGQRLIEFDELAARATTTLATGDVEGYLELRRQAREALEAAMSTQRSLIADFNSHEMRPLWQTDLAENLLLVYLPNMYDNAASFYEFGVPTKEQREAYEKATVEALEVLAQADVRFFQLQGDLAREPDHTALRVNTGLWRRMIDEYYKGRTQFLMANAAYNVALLPDSNVYYQTLGRNPRIEQPQRNNAADERKRMLSLWSVEKLERLAKDQDDELGIRRAATSLMGRSQILNGQIDEGMENLAAATKLAEGATDFTDLMTRLGEVRGLVSANRVAEALDRLQVLRDHETARGPAGILNKLLVLDLTHRVLLARAGQLPPDKQDKARADAYDIYLTYLQDPSLGSTAATLKNYIYRRWEETIPEGADMSTRPAAVVVAVGEIARMGGQDLMWDAKQRGSDDAEASKLRAEGRAKLQRSVNINTNFLKRTDISDTTRAQAMYNLGFANYFLDDRDPANWIAAAEAWTNQADAMPEQPLSTQAITYACQLMRQMHSQPNHTPQVDAMYERAASIALSKYTSTPAADAERLYYATAVLLTKGQLAEAVTVLKGLPSTHENYFLAQRVLLDALLRQFRAAEGEAREQLASQTVSEAQRIITESDRAIALASADQADVIKQAGGIAKIAMADIAIEQHQDANQALALLKEFDQEYGDQPELIGFMLQRRITALFRADQLDEAAQESERMMLAWPDAAAGVISGVLNEIEREVAVLTAQAAEVTTASRERDAMRAQAKSLAEAGVKLGSLLLDWAKDQTGNDPIQLAPYQLMYAQSLRLAGNVREALAIVEPMLRVDALANDAGVIHAAAETYYATGDPQTRLTKAAPQYDRIIGSLGQQNGVYPAIWWNAWMRRLQINDQAGLDPRKIAQNVGRLEFIDPNLGGEPYKTTMTKLKTKHTR